MYKRILLKLSGEVLAGEQGHGIDFDMVTNVCTYVKKVADMGVQIGLVVGGGNFWRGRSSGTMNRTRADNMGMLATVMNSLALCEALEQLGVKARVMSAVGMQPIAEQYVARDAVAHLNDGEVVIFGCGTGCPFFSTDTTAVLRAAEINADVVMMAKSIDGVYTADPKTDPSARKLDEISYMDILSHELRVIDGTAASFGKDNHIPLHIFGITDPYNIVRAIKGEKIGTLVTGA